MANRSLVLVVEDTASNRRVAELLLERHGCTVHVAATGEEALNALVEQNYDLVLMDVRLPGLDGFETTRAIRRRETGLGIRVPIVGVTAHAMQGDRELCLTAGMDDYLSKPYTTETFRAILKKWLPEGCPTEAE